jgi:hypothetical protein
VNLSLTSPTGGASLGAQYIAVLTITEDNDTVTPSTVSFVSATATVNEESGSARLAVQRTGSTAALTVGFTISASPGPLPSATLGADYPSATGNVSFAAGATTGTLVIPLINDKAVEVTTAFTVKLVASPAAVLGSISKSVVTLLDADAAVVTSVKPIRSSAGVPTGVAINFNAALIPADVTITNFTLFSAGKDNKFGTKDDVPIKIATSYTAGQRTVTLLYKQTIPKGEALQIRILSKVRGFNGVALGAITLNFVS